MTPLAWALRRGSVTSTATLLRHGADANRWTLDPARVDAIASRRRVAARSPAAAATAAATAAAPGDDEDVAEAAVTPAVLAATAPSLSNLDALLAAGARPSAPGNADGWTPLHAATADGTRDHIHLLLAYGADATARVPTARMPATALVAGAASSAAATRPGGDDASASPLPSDHPPRPPPLPTTAAEWERRAMDALAALTAAAASAAVAAPGAATSAAAPASVTPVTPAPPTASPAPPVGAGLTPAGLAAHLRRPMATAALEAASYFAPAEVAEELRRSAIPARVLPPGVVDYVAEYCVRLHMALAVRILLQP